MIEFNCFAFLFLLLFVGYVDGSVDVDQPSKSSLLVIILDGFRWDYGRHLSGFERFIENGTHAEYLVPVFPSMKNPNLYSILTGVYPENHGIVSDVMYDPDSQKFFYDGNDAELSKTSWWNGSVPIWTTVTGAGRKVSVYSLPICSVRINDILPDICELHHGGNALETFDKNLGNAIQGFASNKTDFAVVHLDHIGKLGLHFGPNSTEVLNSITDLDRQINKLMDLVESTGLQNRLNIIITSTHGMASVDSSPNYCIQLDRGKFNYTENIVNLDDLEFILSYGAFVGIYPKMDKINKVFDDLKNLDGIDVYKQKDIPEELHIKWSNRTAPIILIAKPGYYIDRAYFSNKQQPPLLNDVERLPFGVIGYDPKYVDEMRGIFYAKGPDFHVKKTIKSIGAVDLYNVMTCLLNVTADHPTNGTATVVCDLLDCSKVCNYHVTGNNGGTNVHGNHYHWCLFMGTMLILKYFN